jgi:hypothetical protein
MRTSLFVLIAVLAFGAATVLCSTRPAIAADERRGEVTKPLAVITSKDSQVREPRCERVTSEQQWKRVWLDHLGMKEDNFHSPRLEVDFDRCFVIAVFRGVSVNCCGVRVASVTERGDGITVRLNDLTYQTIGASEGDNGDRTRRMRSLCCPNRTRR